jgi:asparagine synthase (glutamine-hydrolysing)
LDLEQLSVLIHATEKQVAEDWWIEPSIGLAMLKPNIVIENAQGSAVLSIRGSVLANGPKDPPLGWAGLQPAEGVHALLYDLLDRDTAALRDLRGEFALAFWDGHRRRLLLARDHLGQRGFFFRYYKDWIVFGSDLENIAAKPITADRFDAESAVWYLAFGMPSPHRTLWIDVRRVPAAHVVCWEPGEPLRTIRYWSPLSVRAPKVADNDYIAQLSDVLDKAIANRLELVSPQGLLLSGGIDSSYLARTMHGFGATKMHAFTSRFEEEHGMNETEYAEAVAQWLTIKHTVVNVFVDDALRLLEEVILASPEPLAAWAAITNYRLLEEMHNRDITRLISGLGADEIFGGYDHFRDYYTRYLRLLQRQAPPPGCDAFNSVLLLNDADSNGVLYPGVSRLFDDASLKDALYEPYCHWDYHSYLKSFYRECRQIKPEAHEMELMVVHECQYRIPDLLFANFEPMARSFNIEVSYPYLDPDVIQLVAGLCVESRYRTAEGHFSLNLHQLQPQFKYAMTQLARARLPSEIVDRPRKSFTAPFGGWMTDPRFAEVIFRRCEQSRLWNFGLVRRGWLDSIRDRVSPNPTPVVFQLWALVTLAGWYDQYMEP